MKLLKCIAGVIISFSSLWLGCYFMFLGTFTEWWHFPTLVTSVSLFFTGVGIVYFAAEGSK